jgi:hypothetical protein
MFTFGKDGRFTKDGLVATTITTSPSRVSRAGVFLETHGSGSGTYRIMNNVLELQYDATVGGDIERFSFFRAPGEEEQVIFINGLSYLHR